MAAQPQVETHTPQNPARLTGGFLQINNFAVPWFWKRDPDNDRVLAKRHIDYGELVAKLRDDLSMKTVVIQNLQYTNDGDTISGSLIPKPWEVIYGDPLIEILKEANKNNHAVKTYVGLEYNQALFAALGGTASVQQTLEKQIERDSKLARAIATYTTQNHVQFDGWYITTEIGNFKWSDPARKQQFAQYILKVADACYEQKQVPIAISPYFNDIPSNLDPEQFGRFVRDVLAGSKVSVVMVQDGLGASANNTHTSVLSFFRKLKEYLPANVSIAADVELFKDGNVAPTGRILDQLRLQNELATKDVFAFDILNYMSPMPDDDATESTGQFRISKGDAQKRKALYEIIKNLSSPPSP